MNNIKSFSFYKEYYELITLLTIKEREEILLKIIEFIFEDKEPVNLTESQQKIWNNLKKPISKSKIKSYQGKIKSTNESINETSNEIDNETSNENINEMTNTSNDVNVNNNVLEDKSMREETFIKICEIIIKHLNKVTNSNYKYTTKTTKAKIRARLNENYKPNDFIIVINKKANEWLGTEFENYLCPETLFGTKFEKYLNQKAKKKMKKEVDNTPEWLNKKIEKKQATDEEKSLMENLLKDYKSD